MDIYICAICGDIRDSLHKLSAHIRCAKNHPTTREYYDTYLRQENDGVCTMCCADTKYINIRIGYRKTCSHTCGGKSFIETMKKTPEKYEQFIVQARKNHGVFQNKIKHDVDFKAEWQAKIKSTIQAQYDSMSAEERYYKCSRYENMTQEAMLELNKKGTEQLMKQRGGYKQCMSGKFVPKNPRKYKGDVTNILYRSSYEFQFMQYCDTHPDIINWCSEEVVIPYLSPLDRKYHRYFPDFMISVKHKEKGKQVYLIEIKPETQTKPPKPRPGKKKTKTMIKENQTWAINAAKWEAAKEWCDDRGIKFKIITEKELGRTKT